MASPLNITESNGCLVHIYAHHSEARRTVTVQKITPTPDGCRVREKTNSCSQYCEIWVRCLGSNLNRNTTGGPKIEAMFWNQFWLHWLASHVISSVSAITFGAVKRIFVLAFCALSAGGKVSRGRIAPNPTFQRRRQRRDHCNWYLRCVLIFSNDGLPVMGSMRPARCSMMLLIGAAPCVLFASSTHL